MSAKQSAFAIGELSRRSECSIDTIRYYERMRLMPPVPRSPGGHRLYNDAHLRRLRLIRRSRALGLGLGQVREIVETTEQQELDCARARALLTTQVEAVRRRIADFRRLERTLNRMLAACGDATSANCRVLETALAEELSVATMPCCSRAGSTDDLAPH